MPTNPIALPSGYAPVFAVGYADSSTGDLAVVDGAKPLPVQHVLESPKAPLVGTTSATTLSGPFFPISGRPVTLMLSGNWSGSVVVERSVDGGATRHPLTMAGQPWAQFTSNVCEPIWHEDELDAALYVNISLLSGSVTYRMAQ
ncbi:MAG: hypothetical protein QM681_17760 [Novosphingobium sp.]